MIKAIFFDFDLTLIDSLEIWNSAIERIEKDHPHLDLRGVDQKKGSGQSLDGFAKMVAEHNGNRMHWKEIKKLNSDYIFEGYITAKARSPDFLTELKRKGYILAVISSNEGFIIDTVLKNSNLEFNLILGDEKGGTKADRIKRAIAELRLNKSETMFVGDHPVDIEAAREAGITSVVITSPLHSRKELKQHHPDHIIDELEELNDFL